MMNLEIPNKYGGPVKVREGAIIKNTSTNQVWHVRSIDEQSITLATVKNKIDWYHRMVSLDNTVYILLRNWSLPPIIRRVKWSDRIPGWYGALSHQDISRTFAPEVAIIPLNLVISAYRFIIFKLRFPSKYTLFTTQQQLEDFQAWKRAQSVDGDL